jgi:CheY-like chemotaxis protein
MMPDMDGWEVYNHLKGNPKTQNIPVIVVTARAQTEEKLAALSKAAWTIILSSPSVRDNWLKVLSGF